MSCVSRAMLVFFKAFLLSLCAEEKDQWGQVYHSNVRTTESQDCLYQIQRDLHFQKQCFSLVSESLKTLWVSSNITLLLFYKKLSFLFEVFFILLILVFLFCTSSMHSNIFHKTNSYSSSQTCPSQMVGRQRICLQCRRYVGSVHGLGRSSEKEIVTHLSILLRKSHCTDKRAWQSMVCKRIRHDCN